MFLEFVEMFFVGENSRKINLYKLPQKFHIQTVEVIKEVNTRINIKKRK